MALNPNYLDSLPNSLVDMYSLVEIDILEDMARRISTYDFFIPAAMHQNQKLQELGMTQEHIIKALSAMTGQTQREIVDLLTEAGVVAVEDDVEYYKAADVYKPDEINSEALHKQLNSGLLQTQQAFKNITRTTANTATKQFENALDRAWTQINVGGMDYNTAIHRAIKDLSQAGVGSIQYKSGRVDSLEVAVRRAIVTGANQTASKVQEALADELNVELVEVTAHGGARPNHAKWQGKVFSRNGDIEIEGVKYKDLRKATGYGSAGGLCGVNCRHNFHPYIHGAPRTWSDKALKDLDKKDIEYNGEKYTEYEASQIQRGIERDIRSLKRQVAAIEAGGGDASEERAKLRKAQKAYTDFTEKTGLKKQTARTKVATGTGTEKPAPNEPTNNTNVKPPTKQAAENKVLTNNGNSDIIKLRNGLTKISSSGEVVNPMPETRYSTMRKSVEAKGFSVVSATKGDDFRYLQEIGAEAIADEHGILHMGEVPSASAFFEEIIHLKQIEKYGKMESSDFVERAAREVAANRKLLANGKAYGFTEEDFEEIEANLQAWEEDFKRRAGKSFDESGIVR